MSQTSLIEETGGAKSAVDISFSPQRESLQGGNRIEDNIPIPGSLIKAGGRDLVIVEACYTQSLLDLEFPSRPQESDSFFKILKKKCRCSATSLGSALLSFVPIVGVLRRYSWRKDLLTDLLAGLCVGFIHLPQGLGYGLLADLSPVHGLYTSVFPVLAYMLFGTSPHVSMGTNAVVALLAASIIDTETERHLNQLGNARVNVSSAQLLEYKVGVSTAAAMMEGLILIAMGLLRMGFLTNYMSNSFIEGFSFAAAIHITVSQIVKLFHLKMDPLTGLGKVIFTMANVVRNIADTNLVDVLVGVASGALILGIKSLNKQYSHKLTTPIPAELVVVVLSTLVSYLADLQGRFGVDIVGDIPQGLPQPSVPPTEVMSRIVALTFVDAVLIFVLSISLAKLMAKLHCISIDDNQELVAYGMCQVLGSFFQNFSSGVCAPRTMMLSSMGVKSVLNGLSTVLFLLLVLLVARQLFSSLPIAMLAVMIIVAMKDLLFLVKNIPHMWHVNKGDLVIWLTTVLVSVLGDLDVGLVAGTLTSMLMVLAYSQLARGTLLGKVRGQDLYLPLYRRGVRHLPGIRIFRFDSQLHFASAERFKSEIYRSVFDPTSHKVMELEVSYPESRRESRASRRQSIVTLVRAFQSLTSKVTSPEPEMNSENVGEEIQRSGKVTLEKNINNTSRKDMISTRSEEEKEDEEKEEDVFVRFVVVDCSTMTYVDLTGVEMLHLIITQFSRAGVAMYLAGIPTTTMGILKRMNFFEHEDYSRVYPSVPDALHDILSLAIEEETRGIYKSFA